MTKPHITPTGRPSEFGDEELIVSKTDLRGVITYANDVFQRVSHYTEAELIGQPHNLVRHPDMPRCIFKLLWDTLKDGREVFAYILNLARNGDHYWVFAHVTPSRDAAGRIVGFHSNRRTPYPDALEKIIPFYASLCSEERRHGNPRDGMEASGALLRQKYADAFQDYGQFVFGLSSYTTIEASAGQEVCV